MSLEIVLTVGFVVITFIAIQLIRSKCGDAENPESPGVHKDIMEEPEQETIVS